jgi:hypothetical protein
MRIPWNHSIHNEVFLKNDRGDRRLTLTEKYFHYRLNLFIVVGYSSGPFHIHRNHTTDEHLLFIKMKNNQDNLMKIK